MNHKRGRPKSRRAGCLMCKPHKMNGGQKLRSEVHCQGFGKLRTVAHAANDILTVYTDMGDEQYDREMALVERYEESLAA